MLELMDLQYFNDILVINTPIPHPKSIAIAIAVEGTNVADALGQALRCAFHLFKGGLRDLSVGYVPEARNPKLH